MSLHLLPVPISENQIGDWAGMQYQNVLKENELYFVENIRTARRFISSLKTGLSIDSLQFEVLNKETTATEIKRLVNLLKSKGSGVVLSESGCPGIADPGAVLVDEAHQLGMEIKPFVGPSSLLLALMGSGLSGQQFCFHGYLPIEKAERTHRIRLLEKESLAMHQTQIFIETPYRNASLWNSLLEALGPETRLCFATDVTGPLQAIRQMKVKNWRKALDIQWEKSPTVFLFMAQ